MEDKDNASGEVTKETFLTSPLTEIDKTNLLSELYRKEGQLAFLKAKGIVRESDQEVARRDKSTLGNLKNEISSLREDLTVHEVGEPEIERYFNERKQEEEAGQKRQKAEEKKGGFTLFGIRLFPVKVRENRTLNVGEEMLEEVGWLAEANKQEKREEAKQHLLERGWDQEEAESIINLYRARLYKEKAALRGRESEIKRYTDDMEKYLGRLLEGYTPNTSGYETRKKEVGNMIDLLGVVDKEKYGIKVNQPSSLNKSKPFDI